VKTVNTFTIKGGHKKSITESPIKHTKRKGGNAVGEASYHYRLLSYLGQADTNAQILKRQRRINSGYVTRRGQERRGTGEEGDGRA